MKRKLIEVSLPLEAIGRESADEKSVPRNRRPTTMRRWRARRPQVAARAELFARLVDDRTVRENNRVLDFDKSDFEDVER